MTLCIKSKYLKALLWGGRSNFDCVCYDDYSGYYIRGGSR